MSTLLPALEPHLVQMSAGVCTPPRSPGVHLSSARADSDGLVAMVSPTHAALTLPTSLSAGFSEPGGDIPLRTECPQVSLVVGLV